MVVLPSKEFRVAAIDIGTNSILLTIAEWHDGGPRVLVDRATVTRLGAGVDETRKLTPAAIERSLQCLRHYAQEITAYQVTRFDVVGTSALRDAQASESFLQQAERLLGTRPRVIDGPEEARLTCIGALSGLTLEGPFVVADIGGGSTELIVGKRTGTQLALEHFASLDLGCVRLTERHISTDPPTLAELDAVENAVKTALCFLPFDISAGTLVGVAGTVTTLCAIHLGLDAYDPNRVHGAELDIKFIAEQRRRLSQYDRKQRSAVRGLPVGRADVIIAGAIIVEQLLGQTSRNALLVSDRGVRYGLLSHLFSSILGGETDPERLPS